MKYHNHKKAQKVSQSFRDSRKFQNYREAQGSFSVREAIGSDTIIEETQEGYNHDPTWTFRNQHFGQGRFALWLFWPRRFASLHFGPGCFTPDILD